MEKLLFALNATSGSVQFIFLKQEFTEHTFCKELLNPVNMSAF